MCDLFNVFLGGALYMLTINHGFFVKPVFGVLYFSVRCQSRDLAIFRGSGLLQLSFLVAFGRALTRILDFYLNFYAYAKNKSWLFRETCFWTLVFF